MRIIATVLLGVTALALVFGRHAALNPVARVRRRPRRRHRHRPRLCAHTHRAVARPHCRAHEAHPRGAAQRDRRAPARLGAADPRPHPEPRRCARARSLRIARAQERELRDWLFAGDTPPIATSAPTFATSRAALEIDYPVHGRRGRRWGSRASAPAAKLAAAAREAMLNAARHAGWRGVGVRRIESSKRCEVFVRDRGPGFALAEVPGDRLGVRESIIGRMRRAGGSGVGAHRRRRCRHRGAAAVPRRACRVGGDACLRHPFDRPMARAVRVIVVDDHSIFRSGLQDRPRSDSSSVVGEAHDVESAVRGGDGCRARCRAPRRAPARGLVPAGSSGGAEVIRRAASMRAGHPVPRAVACRTRRKTSSASSVRVPAATSRRAPRAPT